MPIVELTLTPILIYFVQIHNFTPRFFKHYVLQSASLSPKCSFYLQIWLKILCAFFSRPFYILILPFLTIGNHVLHITNLYYKTQIISPTYSYPKLFCIFYSLDPQTYSNLVSLRGHRLTLLTKPQRIRKQQKRSHF